MGIVDINQIPLESAERVERMLRNIPEGAETATKAALKLAAAYLRSASTKQAQKRYAVNAKTIREGENVRVSYDYRNGLQVSVKFAGRRIPLYRFNGSSPKQPTVDTTAKKIHAIIDGKWLSVSPSLPAYGHVLKNTSPSRLPGTFVATMPNPKNAHTGIFERTGGKTANNNDKIEEKMGLSVPQMLKNEEVKERLAQETAAKFEESLEEQILWILNGWR